MEPFTDAAKRSRSDCPHGRAVIRNEHLGQSLHHGLACRLRMGIVIDEQNALTPHTGVALTAERSHACIDDSLGKTLAFVNVPQGLDYVGSGIVAACAIRIFVDPVPQNVGEVIYCLAGKLLIARHSGDS